jgi:uncharacterized protein YaaN involved in tellurite resistance
MREEKNVHGNIRHSLEDSKRELFAYHQFLSQKAQRVRASSRHLEQRLEAIEAELERVSPKILAYKLRRLADSKAVQEVAEKKTVVVTEKIAEFQSNTFKCKHDLEICLRNESNPLMKALCYALFIRCVVKG